MRTSFYCKIIAKNIFTLLLTSTFPFNSLYHLSKHEAIFTFLFGCCCDNDGFVGFLFDCFKLLEETIWCSRMRSSLAWLLFKEKCLSSLRSTMLLLVFKTNSLEFLLLFVLVRSPLLFMVSIEDMSSSILFGGDAGSNFLKNMANLKFSSIARMAQLAFVNYLMIVVSVFNKNYYTMQHTFLPQNFQIENQNLPIGLDPNLLTMTI